MYDEVKRMEQIAVSVIIPVHNGADYIGDTMKCILRQTCQDMEVIIIDDGSVDDTARIIQEVQKEHANLHYYYQEKSNAGVARNYGMHQAKGRYFLFLDGDDLFEDDLVEALYRKITADDADICVCNADQYDTEKGTFISKPQYLRKKYLPQQMPFSRKDIGNAILYFTTSVPWNKMVKRDFIEKQQIAFQDIERANDQYFSVMALLLADRITIVDKILVHYRIKQKGNLTTEFSETPLCAFESMVKVKDTIEDMGLLDQKDVRCAFDNKVLNLMIYSLNIQNTVQGYQMLYDTLTQGGLQKLGVEVREKEYYFNEMEYKNLCSITKMPYDAFLLMKNREYRDTIAGKNASYKEMVKKKDEVIAELKEKEKELNAIRKKNWYRKITRLIDWYHKVFKKSKTQV